jgi:hypothetical protein
MGTLYEAAVELAGLAGNLAGIKGAPEVPPEQINQFPFAVVWPNTGIISQLTNTDYKSLDTLALEIHVARKNLPVAMTAIYPYLDLVAAMLMNNPTLNGTVQTINLSHAEGGVAWSFGELNWQETKTLGFRFDIPVKREEAA